jgi:hypothetical protein
MREATTQCACGLRACSAVIVLITVVPVLSSSSTRIVVPPCRSHSVSVGSRVWSVAWECSSAKPANGVAPDGAWRVECR